jgi:uncharacterized protein DUF5076
VIEKGSLSIPPSVESDPNALEVARVWVSRGTQQVILRVEAWDDPAAWGILLADLARHVANAYEPLDAAARARALERVVSGLDAELSAPTDAPSGG